MRQLSLCRKTMRFTGKSTHISHIKYLFYYFLQLIFRNSFRSDKWLVTYAPGTRRNAFRSLSVTFTDVNHNQNVLRQILLRLANINIYEYLFTRTDRRSECKRRSAVFWTHPKYTTENVGYRILLL
jgi:hypothetical protein